MNGAAVRLYLVIYSFHMPVFIFLTGYFAKFNRKRIGLGFLFSYVVFQTLYLVFDGIVIQKIDCSEIQFQYTTPYWLLWYLMAITFYYLLIPMIDTKDIRVKLVILLLAVVIALLVGNDYSVGMYMTLARAINFFPYFLAGYYLHSTNTMGLDLELAVLPDHLKRFVCTLAGKIATFFSKRMARTLGKVFCVAVVAFAASYVWKSTAIRYEMLYGRASYQDGTYGEKLKLVIMLIAFVWLLALVCVTPNKKISFLTRLGQNTFPVFLCHGFVVKYLSVHPIFTYGTKINLLMSAGIALFLVAVLGNPLVGKVFHYIFMGKWLERREKKKRTSAAP
jgi:fucose 4-O-acetylase-like acetyltransferase